MVVGVKCPACGMAHEVLAPGDYRCNCTAEFRVNPSKVHRWGATPEAHRSTGTKVPRYWYHHIRRRLASGGLGASPASPPLEAYAVFGPGYKEGRFVWLSRKPFGTGEQSEYAKVDITKLANEALRFTNDGHLLHKGNIPQKAVAYLNPRSAI